MRIFAFQKPSKLYVILIGIIILAGLGATIFLGGFHFGIEFNPGSTITVRVGGRSTVSAVEQALFGKYPSIRVQGLSNIGDYLISISDTEEAGFQEAVIPTVRETLSEQFASVTVLESAYVGPTYSRNFQLQTGILIAVAVILMLAYLWFRFQFNFAIASIITLLFHDALLIIVFVGGAQIEITAAVVAAMLTVLGYSLNDTIVVFDRVRENLVLLKNASLTRVINTSITQSLNRTIITSVTTLLASLALVVFAQGAVRNFAIVLSFGVVAGTFSSIFIASPIFLSLEKRRQEKKRSYQQAQGDAASISTERASDEAENTSSEQQSSADDGGIDLKKLREELGSKAKRKPKKKK